MWTVDALSCQDHPRRREKCCWTLQVSKTHDSVDIYVGSSPQPLGVIEDVAIEDCTSLFLVPRYFLPGPYFWLHESLASSLHWNAVPVLPVGPPANHVCAVGNEGVSRAAVDEDSVLVDVARFASAFGIDHTRVRMQPAIPEVRDADIGGFPCRNACAVTEIVGADDSPTVVIIDCRAILLGWMVWETTSGTVSVEALAADIDLVTLCPDGWQLHVEGTGPPGHQLRSGAVIFVSFVPRGAIAAPAREEGGESEPPTDDDMETVSLGDEPAYTEREQDSLDAARPSRSRSPRRHSEPAEGPIPEGFAVAPFLILSQEYRPEPVHLILSGPISVDEAIQRVSAGRFA